jgi:hypothetical protein
LPSPSPSIRKTVRYAALNVVLPLLLAWGLVRSLQTHYYPPDPGLFTREGGSFGPVTLVLQLPGTSAGIEEPLITVGRPGNATFVFIRLLPDARARVGIEFWGVNSLESATFKLTSQSAQINLTVSIPALFPKLGAPEWKSVSEPEQRRLLSEFIVAMDGVVQLKGPTSYNEPPDSPVYIGKNPIGGSFVSDRFSGTVLAHWREY